MYGKTVCGFVQQLTVAVGVIISHDCPIHLSIVTNLLLGLQIDVLPYLLSDLSPRDLQSAMIVVTAVVFSVRHVITCSQSAPTLNN